MGGPEGCAFVVGFGRGGVRVVSVLRKERQERIVECGVGGDGDEKFSKGEGTAEGVVAKFRQIVVLDESAKIGGVSCRCGVEDGEDVHTFAGALIHLRVLGYNARIGVEHDGAHALNMTVRMNSVPQANSAMPKLFCGR